MLHQLGDLFEGCDQIRRLAGTRFREHRKDALELTCAKSRRKPIGNTFIKGNGADSIALPQQKKSEGSDQRARVFVLGVIDRTVLHRLALIDHQIASTIRFILETFLIVPIGPSIEFPIDRFGIIADRIGAILAEFDRETVLGTSVQSGLESVDNFLGTPLQIANRHERL
jgi:hypothetical protein